MRVLGPLRTPPWHLLLCPCKLLDPGLPVSKRHVSDTTWGLRTTPGADTDTGRHAAHQISMEMTACMLCAKRTVTMGSSSFGMWKNAIINAMATRISCHRVHTISRLGAAALASQRS